MSVSVLRLSDLLANTTLTVSALQLQSEIESENFRTEWDFGPELLKHSRNRLTSSVNWVEVEPYTPKKNRNEGGLKSKIRIFIDPGHGGKDEGAQGFWGVSEKIISLKVSNFLQLDLKSLRPEYEVRLSREGDVFLSLNERITIANDWGASLFISIHANSSPVAKAKGFEVYFLSSEATDEEAKKLALLEGNTNELESNSQEVRDILTDVIETQHIHESGLFAETVFNSMNEILISNKRGVRQGPFTVLSGTEMPAILIEIGYVTHIEEAKSLSKTRFLKKLSNAISSGIIKFIDEKRLSE